MPLLLIRIVGWIGLALTAIPSFLYLGGAISLDAVKLAMIVGTVVWFVASPLVQYLGSGAD